MNDFMNTKNTAKPYDHQGKEHNPPNPMHNTQQYMKLQFKQLLRAYKEALLCRMNRRDVNLNIGDLGGFIVL